MKIQVQLKQSYGRDLIYPVCDKAKAFAALVGQKTLTDQDIKIITKSLGFELEWIPGSIEIG